MLSPSPRSRLFETPRGGFHALEWQGPPGKPTLVFCHANGFNAATYKRLLTPLAAHATVVALDARGHGLSSAPAVPEQMPSWQTYADDLNAVLAQVQGPVHLAGHSFGAVVALQVAEARGARSLTLIEPVIPPPLVSWAFRVGQAVGLHIKHRLVTQSLRRRAWFEDAEAIRRAYAGRGAFATWQPGWLEDYIEGGFEAQPGGGLALRCAPAWESRTFERALYNSWAPLARLTAPTAIAFGTTRSTFHALSVKAARRRSPARLLRFEGASHFLPMELPDRVVELLCAQLGSESASDVAPPA